MMVVKSVSGPCLPFLVLLPSLQPSEHSPAPYFPCGEGDGRLWMCNLSQGDLHFKRGAKENFASSQVKVIKDRTSRVCREVFEGAQSHLH